MQNKYQSPWFVEALQAEGEFKINKLKTNLTTDICIVEEVIPVFGLH